MAIISGMKAAVVDDVKPFELPIESIGLALTARQKRADEAKKNYGIGASSLIFDTRDLPTDVAERNKIADDYAQTINNEVDALGGDWSMMDNSVIQAIAMDAL